MPEPAFPPKILLVDDYEDAREMYAESLALAGFDVTTAQNGEEAIAVALAGSFDLVVLDLALPKVDGFTVIRTLRADPRTRTVPIVTLSASTNDSAHAAVIEAGGDLALDKPCLPEELEVVVRELVARGKRRRAVSSQR